MPGNMGDMLGMGGQEKPGSSFPVPGSMPASQGPSPMGNIKNMMKGMPASGLKTMASSLVAVCSKVLESVLVGFGTETPEGKNILKAVKILNGVAKGQKSGNMDSTVQSLVASLPEGMKINPADLTSVLSELTKGAGGGGGAGGPAPPPQMGGANPLKQIPSGPMGQM